MFGDWELKVVSSTDNQCTVHKNPFSECLVTGNSKW